MLLSLAWWSNYKANGFSHYSLSVFAYFRSCASLTNMAEEATTQHNSKPPSSSLGTNPITLTHAIALIQPSKLPCIYFLPDETGNENDVVGVFLSLECIRQVICEYLHVVGT